MFLIGNDKKAKKSNGGFAEGVRALSDLLTVGLRLATMTGFCLFIYIIRDGLAEAFTRDFVRLSVVGAALLAVGAAYAVYRMVDRAADSFEEAAQALAEKSKTEKETERLRLKQEQDKQDQRMLEIQAMFAAALSGGGQRGAAGALQKPRPRPKIKIEKKAKRSVLTK